MSEVEVDLSEIADMLHSADSFIDTVEELCGDAVVLSGLMREHTRLDAQQCGHLGVFNSLGRERSLTPELVENARAAMHRRSQVRTHYDGYLVAAVESWVLMGRLPLEARLKLTHTGETLGRIVYPMGVLRRSIDVEQLVGDDDRFTDETALFHVQARLDLGDIPVALVQETLYGAAVPG